MLFQLRYRVRAAGRDDVPAAGGVLLLGNHVSWIDWAMVQIACPRTVRFVMAHLYYDRWYLRWLFRLMGCIPIQAGVASRSALATVAAALDAGRVVCLFPEGGISRNGRLGAFRRGYEAAAGDAADSAVIVPFYLHGLYGSRFSYSAEGSGLKRRTGLRRNVNVAFGAPLPKDTPPDTLRRRVLDISIAAWQVYARGLATIPQAWVATAKRLGGKRMIVDPVSGELTARRALIGAICFARRIRRLCPEPNVGILLPSSTAGVLTNLAALLAGKTVVNLNYTASGEALNHAMESAGIRTVFTSPRFLERLAKRGIDCEAALGNVKTIHLEDLRAGIGKAESVASWLLVRALPARLLRLVVCDARDSAATAVILFSSGSEGMPKGVMLSHRNIMANASQIAEALSIRDDDLVLASLPLFHAFGLNALQFMPLVTGISVACFPDPTDVRGIAKTVAEQRATIMCSTSTFLRLFIRNSRIEPDQLQSLRLVVAGAEPLNLEVRDSFEARFGAAVFEGYGCTETAPVAGANLPDPVSQERPEPESGFRPGMVGTPLNGTNFRIVDPDTFAELPPGEQGMILIGGPQLMQGYLGEPEKTEQALREIDGVRWFVTGDKGSLDADGFLTIRDRYSRFAKIGGEMVSLGEVERAVRACLDDQDIDIAAVSVADPRKGEAIVLLHAGELDTGGIEKALLSRGIPGLMIPSRWMQVDAVPMLGTGKTDFVAAKALVSQSTGAKV